MEPENEPPAAASGQPSITARRRMARLLAVQALYQIELTGNDADVVAAEVLQHRAGGDADATDQGLFHDIVRETHRRRADFNALIDDALSEGWTANRLEILLSIILRCGAYELSARPEVPVRVVINEYVELAHAFFGGREPGMANGVLDALARRLRPGDLDASDNGPAD